MTAEQVRAYLSVEENRAKVNADQLIANDNDDEDEVVKQVLEIFEEDQSLANRGGSNHQARIGHQYHGESFHQGE